MDNILITGGTSGIGQALASVFAANKYNLTLNSGFEIKLSKPCFYFPNLQGHVYAFLFVGL